MASYLLTIPHHLLVHHRTNWKQFPRSVALSSSQEWRCSWHLIPSEGPGKEGVWCALVEGGVAPGWSFFSRRNKRERPGNCLCHKGGKKKKAACGRTGKLLTMDMEKAEVLSEFYASVFTGNLLCLLSRWLSRQGLGKQSPSYCERRSGLRAPEEPERT